MQERHTYYTGSQNHYKSIYFISYLNAKKNVDLNHFKNETNSHRKRQRHTLVLLRNKIILLGLLDFKGV